MNYRARAFGRDHGVECSAVGTADDGFARLRYRLDGGPERVAEARLEGDRVRLRLNGRVVDVWLDARTGSHEDYVAIGGDRLAVEVRRGGAAGAEAAGRARGGRVAVTSPMPGRVVAVRVTAGQRVSRGDLLFTLEAMKMQNEFIAPVDGHVASLSAAPGRVAAAGEVLAEIEPDKGAP